MDGYKHRQELITVDIYRCLHYTIYKFVIAQSAHLKQSAIQNKISRVTSLFRKIPSHEKPTIHAVSISLHGEFVMAVHTARVLASLFSRPFS